MDCYVPVFFNWIEDTQELNDQEKGRLIDAIVLYARGGDWQERINGNERYVFPIFKGNIERQRNISEKRSVAGAKGGNSKQIKANTSKVKQTEANLPEEEKEEEKENEYEKEKYVVVDVASPTPQQQNEIIGIDGLPLELDRVGHLDKAEKLVKRFRMPFTENVIQALADDIGEKGLETVQNTLIKAAESDVRGGVSLNYYRAILNNSGQKKGLGSWKPDQMIRHTEQERTDSMRKAVIDLDAM